jgi:hypothetical protein
LLCSRLICGRVKSRLPPIILCFGNPDVGIRRRRARARELNRPVSEPRRFWTWITPRMSILRWCGGHRFCASTLHVGTRTPLPLLVRPFAVRRTTRSMPRRRNRARTRQAAREHDNLRPTRERNLRIRPLARGRRSPRPARLGPRRSQHSTARLRDNSHRRPCKASGFRGVCLQGLPYLRP